MAQPKAYGYVLWSEALGFLVLPIYATDADGTFYEKVPQALSND